MLRFIAVALLMGCGSSVGPGGMDVGKACTPEHASTDCYHVCVTGSAHFPGRNFCSERCSSDNDCPSGSVCIAPIALSDGSHVCAVTCKIDDATSCSSFGAAYVCSAVDRYGSAGQVDICWVP